MRFTTTISFLVSRRKEKAFVSTRNSFQPCFLFIKKRIINLVYSFTRDQQANQEEKVLFEVTPPSIHDDIKTSRISALLE
jgi:hypothetical protein